MKARLAARSWWPTPPSAPLAGVALFGTLLLWWLHQCRPAAGGALPSSTPGCGARPVPSRAVGFVHSGALEGHMAPCEAVCSALRCLVCTRLYQFSPCVDCAASCPFLQLAGTLTAPLPWSDGQPMWRQQRGDPGQRPACWWRLGRSSPHCTCCARWATLARSQRFLVVPAGVWAWGLGFTLQLLRQASTSCTLAATACMHDAAVG